MMPFLLMILILLSSLPVSAAPGDPVEGYDGRNSSYNDPDTYAVYLKVPDYSLARENYVSLLA